MEHKALAAELKCQLNDIIDIAYANDRKRQLFKNFKIECLDRTMRSFLGDCRIGNNGAPSHIRILALSKECYKDILIVTIHEVSHHIENIIYGTTGHQKTFYDIHKKLLFTAMDMGILHVNDVINSESHARNRNKLAGMMKDYVPHPIDYKKDSFQIFVYNSFSIKDQLKQYGYKWNSLDTAWVLKTTEGKLEQDKAYLASLQVNPKNVKIVKGSAVISRLCKTVYLYNVPFEQNELVKRFGYRWDSSSSTKRWKKKLLQPLDA